MTHPASLASVPAPEPGGRPGIYQRWRRQSQSGLGVLAYRGVRKLLRRWPALGLQFSVHQLITAAPWRLRLPARAARQLRVRELGAQELGRLGRIRPDEAAFAQRFGQGHRCLAAFLEEEAVAFVWFVPGPARLPTSFGGAWEVPASTLWLYDLYSDPEVLGAIGHLYAFLRQHPPGEGFRRLAGQIELDNLKSRRSHRSLGYQERSSLVCVRWRDHTLFCQRDQGRAARGWGRGWSWTRGAAVIALPGPAVAEARPQSAPARALQPAAEAEAPRVQCHCGRGVKVGAADPVCACGHRLGRWRQGVLCLGAAIPYWGEIEQAPMRELLRQSERDGYRDAALRLLPDRLHDYVLSPDRAAFEDLMELPAGARILDIGAGWGAIACPLARRYRVTALEGVWERTHFMALRKQQEGLEQLTILNGDVHATRLQPGQFDAIVANGILEWAAMLDTTAGPRAVQLKFMQRLRGLMAPGGVIYLAIENRCGLPELRGEADHSGLPFTSLMPRPLARWVCARSRSYRSRFNVGYRTYTYTHRGYRKLFGEVGLDMTASWVCPSGYNNPTRMIPLHSGAIRFAHPPTATPPAGWKRRVKQWGRQQTSRAWVWRWVGADFAFLLRPMPDLEADFEWQAGNRTAVVSQSVGGGADA